MIYLKLYEDYESYQPIDADEYYDKTIFANVRGNGNDDEDPLENTDYIKNNWDSYSRGEIKEILDILPKGTKYTINAAMNPIYPKGKLDIMNVEVGRPDGSSGQFFPRPLVRKKSGQLTQNIRSYSEIVDFFIVKLKDEWYYLYVNNHFSLDHYWKCDQLSGLLKCMKQYLI